MCQDNYIKYDTSKLEGKKILFFSADFFGYDKEIKQGLINAGAKVDMYDDRPNNSFLAKSMIRINPRLYTFQTHKYFKKIVQYNKKQYDYVFFITCEAALEKDLKLLKENYSTATFILYLYDSLSNLKYFDIKKEYFDKICSFDTEDIKIYKEIKFLPLFYIDCYKNEQQSISPKYDVSFIGTSHSDRPFIINQIRKQMQEDKRDTYFKLYTPTKIIHYLKLLLNMDYRELNKNHIITLNKMDSCELANIINLSKAVVDIQHPLQNGLTMRTIELLAMKKKMIMTNNNITQYNFYSKNNIHIIDRNNIKIDTSFFDNIYENIDESIYQSYSLETWINNIFE